MLTLLLCIFTAVSNAQEKPVDITLNDGKILKNARVSKVDPDGLRIVHDDGMTKVAMEDLPPALKEKYSFDSSQAKQFRKDQQMARQQSEAEEKQRLQEENAEKERKAELARKEEEKAKNTPRVTTAESIKSYWIRSLPVPEGLTDHQYTSKLKFAESMTKLINSGQLDLEAEKTALQWNQSEYQRVGQNENANALNAQIVAVQEAITKRDERKQQAEIAQMQAQLQAANIASMQQLTRALNDVAFQMMKGGTAHW